MRSSTKAAREENKLCEGGGGVCWHCQIRYKVQLSHNSKFNGGGGGGGTAGIAKYDTRCSCHKIQHEEKGHCFWHCQIRYKVQLSQNSKFNRGGGGGGDTTGIANTIQGTVVTDFKIQRGGGGDVCVCVGGVLLALPNTIQGTVVTEFNMERGGITARIANLICCLNPDSKLTCS